MLTAKKIKCRPRSVGQRNWAAQFERWLGYPLHRDARRAISVLERQRAQRKPQRLYLCDADAEKEALKQALVNYVRWLGYPLHRDARRTFLYRRQEPQAAEPSSAPPVAQSVARPQVAADLIHRPFSRILPGSQLPHGPYS